MCFVCVCVVCCCVQVRIAVVGGGTGEVLEAAGVKPAFTATKVRRQQDVDLDQVDQLYGLASSQSSRAAHVTYEW